MHKVTVNGKTLFCEDGAVLGDVINSSGEALHHPCGKKGICKKCTVSVNGKEELSCQYRIYSDIDVRFSDDVKIASDSGIELTGDSSSEQCFALDIGTTTVALALIDKKSGKAISVITEPNPQRSYGADVISRIEACKKYSVTALRDVLINKINTMLGSFPENKADEIYAAGNTVMLHILTGKSPVSMGTAPYSPVFLEEKILLGEKTGLHGIKTVYTLPCISSFVGADIVAGLSCTEKPGKDKYCILVDLGTNAEIVLFSENEYICTSAAAGPCFEGVGIECGMNASEGAICEYNSASVYRTIENAPARGICATGLIDIIAVLLKNGIIDETGYMETKKFRITDDVFISDKDIRQFQNAKAAVCAGILTLIKISGISYESIGKVYISGGFAAEMNIDNAVITGIIPKKLKDKCLALRNTSLAGTIKYACGNRALTEITAKARYEDLSLNKDFAEIFIDNMLFQ